MPDRPLASEDHVPGRAEPASSPGTERRRADTEARRQALVSQVTETAAEVLIVGGLEHFSAKAVVAHGNYTSGSVSELIGGRIEMLELLLSLERRKFEEEAVLINLGFGLDGAIEALYKAVSTCYRLNPELSIELDKYQLLSRENVGVRNALIAKLASRHKYPERGIFLGEELIAGLMCDISLGVLIRNEDPARYLRLLRELYSRIVAGPRPVGFPR